MKRGGFKGAKPTAEVVAWYDSVSGARLVLELLPEIGRVRLASVPEGTQIRALPSPLFKVDTLRAVAAKLTQMADLLELIPNDQD